MPSPSTLPPLLACQPLEAPPPIRSSSPASPPDAPSPVATVPGFWQDVVERMTEALIVVGPDRTILYSNQRAQELTGMTLAEARGLKCVDAIACPHCQCECRLFGQGEIRDVPVTVYPHGSSHPRTFVKNGHLIRDAEGVPIAGVETFKDVTVEVEERLARERHAVELFREKMRYEALLNGLAEGVFCIDESLHILEFSARLSELTGFARREALGQNLVRLLELSRELGESPRLTELAARSLRVALRRQDGRYVPVELHFRPIRHNAAELIGIIRELTSSQGGPEPAAGVQGLAGLVSVASVMKPVFSLISHAAQADINVLIEGESGTGKELVARAIHRLGGRSQKPFYAVNCATFTGSLLLSELFGYERGAFTGAVKQKRGKLELAEDGTLFLDEISEIPIQHQALLLRVLEERTFERLGGHTPIPVRARILAATNQNLSRALQAGTFREDLYYRLKVMPIRLPPLRERREDIVLLTRHFLAEWARGEHRPVPVMAPEVLEAFQRYCWPGNVRELRNMMEYLCSIGPEYIGLELLPAELRGAMRETSGASRAGVPTGHPVLAAGDADQAERARILAALEQARYCKTTAARLLGMNRSTLWRKLQRLGLEV